MKSDTTSNNYSGTLVRQFFGSHVGDYADLFKTTLTKTIYLVFSENEQTILFKLYLF